MILDFFAISITPKRHTQKFQEPFGFLLIAVFDDDCYNKTSDFIDFAVVNFRK